MSEIHVTGLADLQKFLDTLPAKLEANVVRGALGNGARIILADAKTRAPVGPANQENKRLYGGYQGALRDSLRISTKIKNGKVTATITAGGKNRKSKADVFYAHMIEFGTRAHNIASKKGFLSFMGGFFKSVNHPGMAPHPFMRPALDGQAQNAVVAAAEYMRKRLADKHGLDTSGVMIEGDT